MTYLNCQKCNISSQLLFFYQRSGFVAHSCFTVYYIKNILFKPMKILMKNHLLLSCCSIITP